MARVTDEGAHEPMWNEPWTRDDGAAKATKLFTQTFGHQPHGVWSAPGRLNLIGEHTDYNHGLCLATTLRHRTYVAVGLRGDTKIRMVSARGDKVHGPGAEHIVDMDDVTADTAPGWTGYVAGVIWAMRERGFDGIGLDVAVASCVPLGAGLSSSGALESAVALAVNDLWRLALDNPKERTELAESCIEAEGRIVGVPTGGLDPYTALFCTDGDALEMDFLTSPAVIRDTPLYFPEYGLDILITDTRVSHDLADGRYAERRRECEAAAAALDAPHLRAVADQPDGLRRVNSLEDETLRKRARHVVNEIDRVRRVASELSGTGPAHERLVEVGSQLYRAHTSLAVDFEVSCAELDLAVHTAWTGGALGARMVGGGFGGSTISLLRRNHVDVTARAIAAAFSEAGMRQPQFLRV